MHSLAHDVGDVLYAGLLYDQVWALALAINNAIELYNISMEDYSYDQYEVTDKIEESLSQVSFRGATGHIMFSRRREVSTPINIYQVNSYASEPHVPIGYYDSYHKTINITTNNLPTDEISTVVISIPSDVAIGLYVAVLSVAIIVTIILICLLYHRSKPPVKATSPFVSLLIFLGCYLALLNDLMRITYASFPHVISDILFVVFCNVSLPIFFNGCTFIFFTLLIKLMRVRKIFYNKKLSKYLSPFWSNKVIAMVVIMMTVFPNLVILSWMILDPYRKKSIITNNTDGPLLYNEKVNICKSSRLEFLFIFIFLYLFIIFVITIITSSRTRKIKHKDFKDTKKVNAFIYLYVLTFTFMACLIAFFDLMDMPIIAHYFAISFSLIIVCECVFILFLPKLISLLFNNEQSDVVNFL
ncbi:PREDICTED: gamma-aminobutyric acid type B receptor subunit 1-like [Amphimedon queenslandica]|uniref:G-protein coupled receptors family 3 profile domain-containing protein n=1 Tax=Amphimedon queenslandica TaxID=400682 RepID=A0AAN0J2B9_AMPQE|nr:PREDICTED: gamma-aminobutyric acid type B receptor subunit 1-like [Amphimedon queenslandica]|eukprot:XP_019850866.1 PREDICTED: gamma-aminobutyric acid type B receptor subunit 1-like [Amphimedon queenslandica]